MKDSRKKLLQLVYDHDQSVGGVLQIPMDGSGTDLDLVTLRDDVTTLIRQGYLTQPIRIIRTFCLSLTEKGEEYVENGFSLPSPSQSSYNFSGATIHNATIGNENTVGSMVYNSTSALSELESAINHQPLENQAALNEMLDILRDLQRTEQPIEKSRLTRFYELVKKSSDLVLPIGKFLFEVIFAPRG
jgi:hypothetical protein